MYCVYWCSQGKPFCLVKNELTQALQLCEEKRQTEGVTFVTMAVQDPNHVGKMGVAEAGPDYDWTKRRDAISVRHKEMKK